MSKPPGIGEAGASNRHDLDQVASFPIVGVGASAGGLEAFTELLKQLPIDTGMGFVLVQHLDPQHESALTQILKRATSMPVDEVSDNLPVEPNHIYVIPRNTSLTITSGKLGLHSRQRSFGLHHPIDAFFESLAQDQHERAIGVVLSGTATDGTLGLEAIKAEGGITFAQDDSARYDSMPRSAVAAGCVDFVLSPSGIAKELARIAKHPYVAGQASEPYADDDDPAFAAHDDGGPGPPSDGPEVPPTAQEARAEAKRRRDLEGGFKDVLLLLRSHSGVDFSLYKATTIRRRIARRMVLNKQDTLTSYADFLHGNAKELDALYSDTLISVTSFFRNPEAFDVLRRKVFPKLLQRPGDEQLRVWVLGCSTGQEAYSIAMTFLEAADKAPRGRKLQVFATDLSDTLLDKARHGLYAKTLEQDVSPERLRRFFVEEEGGYRISKALRQMVVFARHNLISDTPFSRMDLISCRNVLIYLDPGSHQKTLPVFHYALKPDGFLFLGASESIGSFTDLFEPVDKKNKIYSRVPAPKSTRHLPVKGEGRARPPTAPRLPLSMARGQSEEGASRGELNALREADRLTVQKFAPPGVLVNSELQVLQFRGETSRYLQPPTGKATFDILKMAREGLVLPLRAAINKAKKENKTVRKDGVRVVDNASAQTTSLEVIPLRNLKERCYLILFTDTQKVGRATSHRAKDAKGSRSLAPKGEKSRRISELEVELSETRDYLQSIQEQYEATKEELQSFNEEVQSANEELQSINEELETSKEELESANEELTTVNEEMSNRNAELNRLNSDLVNLQTSTHLAIVLLSRDLTIRRFSAEAERQLNLLAADIGRPIGAVRHNLVFQDHDVHASGRSPEMAKSPPALESVIAEVIATVRECEWEVRDKAGRWFSLRVRPYLNLENEVDGAVMVLTDIDDLKRSEEAIAHERDYAEAIIRTARDPLVVLDADLRLETANDSFYETFKVSRAKSKGQLIYEIGNREWDIPQLRQLLEDIVPRDSSFNDFEVTHDFETIGRRSMLLNARRLSDPSGAPAKVLLGIQDITETHEYQAAIRESQTRYQALIQAAAQTVWTAAADGAMLEDSPSWREFTGQTYKQWKGSGWLDALHPDDRERTRELWQRAVVERTPVETEYRLRHASGEWRWTAVRIVPVLDSDGSVREWVGMNSDITERKRAEEALREGELHFRQLADSMPQIVWTARADGYIDYYNQRWYEYTGFAEQYGQESWEPILHPDDVARCVTTYFGCVRSGEPYQIEYRFKDRFRGGYRWFMGRALPIRNESGEILRWFGTCTDIDKQKRLEEELANRVEELAAIDLAKGEFFAVLSHELRQPLNAIRGWLHLLKRPDLADEDRRKGLEVIDRNSMAQSHLIGDLLDAHRISTGKVALDLEYVDLRGELDAAVAGVEPAAVDKAIRIEREMEALPTIVSGDPRRLQQVFGNLLGNALKFTPEGGVIRVVLRRRGSSAEVTITDTGHGISEAALPHVFDLFRQTQADRSHKGLGLGLSIAKQLVDLHGGSMSASSPGRGQGATFTITLPIHDEASPVGSPLSMESSEVAPGVTLGGAKILVVDNEPHAREPVRRLLEEAGAEVVAVASVDEALEALQSQRPDVLVSDIAMPGKDGYHLIGAIRALSRARGGRTPAIALTACGTVADRALALGAGFQRHLVKPVEPAVLIAAVTALASSAKTRKDRAEPREV